MTSKTLYFNLMKEDIKRRLWLLALTVLAFFFRFPVEAAVMAGRVNGTSHIGRMRDITRLFSVNNGMVFFFILVGSLIWGATGFSYLHSKQKVDFYHCLPVRREKLFAVQFLDGILVFAAAYLVNMAAGMAVAGVNGILAPEAVSGGLVAFVFFMVHFLLMYSVIVLAMMLTGNTVVGIVGAGVIHVYGPAVLFLTAGYLGTFLTTSYQDGMEYLEKLLQRSSPLAVFIYNWSLTDGREPFPVAGTVGALCLGAVISFLALWVYKMRKSEAAGRAMAFKAIQPVIRILVVLLSALAGGMFFWMLHSKLGWALFGILCGLLLSHCVTEIIYNSDFRKLFSHRLQLVLCGAAAVAVFLGFFFDVFGYDRYVPKASELESASIYIRDLSSGVNYGRVAQGKYGETYWKWEDGGSYAFEHMKLNQYDELLTIAEEGVKQNENRKKELYGQGRGYGWMGGDVSIQYELKNGRKVRRRYAVEQASLIEPLKVLFAEEAYKTGTYPILSEQAGDIGYMEAAAGGEPVCLVQGGLAGQEGAAAKLFAAYQEDLKTLTVDTMLRETPVASIGIMEVDTYRYAMEEKEGEDHYNWERYLDVYPVYPSFKKTLQLLEDNGLRGVTTQDVQQIIINTGEYGYWEDAEIDGGQVIITDRNQIDEIMENAVCREYLELNPFCASYSGLSMEVRLGSGLDQKGVRYILPEEYVPEYLKKQLG